MLNGTKRYITNGAIADVLTVMARTPDPKGGESKVTAFLVTPDMPGFEVVEAADGQVRHPRDRDGEARLPRHARARRRTSSGPLGKGLQGRADGARLRPDDLRRELHRDGQDLPGRRRPGTPPRRRQFGRPLADLELVKKKLAFLAATAYAMEATTYETAALIDRGAEDYMLETAILKVFSTEALWQGVYETLQVHGGQGYFTDEPYERMMRDARINTIGEGANEVLKAFIALVGMRDVGEGLKATLDGPEAARDGSCRPSGGSAASGSPGWSSRPPVPVALAGTPARRRCASAAASRRFAWAVERVLVTHREAILERQYVQERIADAAIAPDDRLLHAGPARPRPEHRDRHRGRPRRRQALPPHGQPPFRPGPARPRPQRRPRDDRGRRGRAPWRRVGAGSPTLLSVGVGPLGILRLRRGGERETELVFPLVAPEERELDLQLAVLELDATGPDAARGRSERRRRMRTAGEQGWRQARGERSGMPGRRQEPTPAGRGRKQQVCEVHRHGGREQPRPCPAAA